MKRVKLHYNSYVLIVACSCVLSATAGPPSTTGTTDPAVLSTIAAAEWDASLDGLYHAIEVPGPARGRYRRDGSLVAVLESSPRNPSSSSSSSSSSSEVRPATAMTADRLDNNVCMVTQSTGPDKVCKVSPNQRFKFCLQNDANIVLYDGTNAYWASNTQGAATQLPLRLCVQADGNLVAYDSSDSAFWSSDTCCDGKPTPMTAFIQNDGNLALYDGTCAAIWATNTFQAKSVRPPCSAAGSGPRVTLREKKQVTGPFGGGDPNNNGFDDASFSSTTGVKRITQINVRGGAFIDAIQFKYGNTLAPWRGGSGGDLKAPLILQANEWITQAWVRSGAYVDEIRFFTSKGRYWSTSGDPAQSGDKGVLASPCPANAYRLVSIRGVEGSYLERIEFVWQLAPSAVGPFVSKFNMWSYLPGETPVFRVASTGQPQCLSSDGKSCTTSKDGFSLRMCADILSTRPVTCAASDGANDPLHWCNKARGALGLPSPGVPIRIAFYNVEVCDSGLALTDHNALINTLYNDPHSLKYFWEQASNGRAFFDESTSAITDLRLPCDRFPITTCDVGGWFDYARDNPAALGGHDVSQYQIQTFIAPRTAACDEKPIGFAVGALTWIRVDFVEDLNMFKHEIGHNLGLPHAGRIIPPAQVEVYGDNTTPMGYCAKCIYNSVDQLRLGWSRALPVVDWSKFTGSVIVTLPVLSDPAAFRDLGVIQIQLSSPSEPGVPGGVTKTVYLSYKVAKDGQDAGLRDMYSSATSVHGIHPENGESWLLAWPKTGQAFVNIANKMVVRQDSGSDDEAKVTLCKWVSSHSECGSYDTFVRPGKSDA